MFAKLEGDQALLLQSGVYKPADLYEFNGALFAKTLGGFVRLYKSGATSKPAVSLIELHTNAPLWSDRFGRLAVTENEGYTAIPANALRIGKE
jgi:hypothetical protein